MNLNLDERTKIFEKVCRLVETKHFNPGMNGVDWNALAQSRKDQVLACTEPEAFEKEVGRLVAGAEAGHGRKLTDDSGLLKVAMFPGAIGIDVAKDIDRGIATLDGCRRLIVDLRGNTGGGIGGLRLMSYLTPGKLEVGYSLTRKSRERGYKREELTRFGRIPSHKATLVWLAAPYAFVEKTILVITERLGQRQFHSRVWLL